MKKQLLLILILGLTSLNLFSQNENPYRQEFVLNLPVNGDQYYEQKVGKSPYFVHDNVLQIYPGEKLFIEVKKTGNSIDSMKVVKVNINPEKTIIVEFTQNVKDRKSESMFLNIVNPFDKDLEYKAMMYIVGQNKWIKTHVLPVKSKLTGIEMWSDVIITLVLSDWKLN
ncbi:MAG: hypothetical protein Q8928_12360 [Bacteroidota bacterium]|nr:hypothetical protein [Bacteroidota bacterium]